MDWKDGLVERVTVQHEGGVEGDGGEHLRIGGREPRQGGLRAYLEGFVPGVQGEAAGAPARGSTGSRTFIWSENTSQPG